MKEEKRWGFILKNTIVHIFLMVQHSSVLAYSYFSRTDLIWFEVRIYVILKKIYILLVYCFCFGWKRKYIHKNKKSFLYGMLGYDQNRFDIGFRPKVRFRPKFLLRINLIVVIIFFVPRFTNLISLLEIWNFQIKSHFGLGFGIGQK